MGPKTHILYAKKAKYLIRWVFFDIEILFPRF